MKNWAGNLSFNPQKVFSPANNEDVKSAVKEAISDKKYLRLIGSGHSWTGLIASDEYFMTLDNMQGLISVDKDKGTIRAKAGTKLSLFGDIGHEHNLAMENQGDINLQSIAGATSTGTHGTGITLQSVANQISGMTLINGHGEEVAINEEHPDFNAARLSLGSLGVITDLTFKLKPSYKLKVETFAESFDESLSEFDQRIKNNRHLEMFYFPVGDWSLTKFMNLTDGPPTPKTLMSSLNEKVLENWLYTQLNRVASTTGRYKMIDKIMRSFVSRDEKVNWSHLAFPTERSFRFMEMEYNLPYKYFKQAMAEIREAIKTHQFRTLFPIEIRFVKADDLWLSPAYQRDSVYFAVHTYISEDYKPYFDCMEKIFRKYEGRPHWGKMHTQTKSELETTYPKFNDFLKVREKYDPKGIFLNPHLRTIFGL